MQVSLIPEYGDIEYICVFRGLYDLEGLSKSRGLKVTYGSNFTFWGSSVEQEFANVCHMISEVLYEHSTHISNTHLL